MGKAPDEKLHSLYHSANIGGVIKSRNTGEPVARMEEGRSVLKILTGKSTVKRFLGRPRRRREGSIRKDFKEIVRGIGIFRLKIGIFIELL